MFLFFIRVPTSNHLSEQYRGPNSLGEDLIITLLSTVDSKSKDRTTTVRKHQGLGSPPYHVLSLSNDQL
jgi:hypothetical protein